MRLRTATQMLFAVCFLVLSACASSRPQRAVQFEGRWFFTEIAPGKAAACLPQEDVEVLREKLIRCNQR